MKVFFYYSFLFLYIFCNSQVKPKAMSIPQKINKELALEYFQEYAKFEKEDLSECIKIDNDEKIRGEVGSAEFEYRLKDSIFIIRGLIDKDISKANPKVKKLIIEKLMELNINLKSNDGVFEYDTTAVELQKKYPERLNLQKTLYFSIDTKEFVRIVDTLADKAYKFEKTQYLKILDEVNTEVFPN